MTDFFLFIPGYVPEQITVVKDKILNFRRIHCRKDVVYTKIVNSKIQSCKCGTKVQEFSAEEAACPAFSAVGTPLGSTRAHHKSLRKVQWFNPARAGQKFKCSRVQMFKSSKVQSRTCGTKFKSSKVLIDIRHLTFDIGN